MKSLCVEEGPYVKSLCVEEGPYVKSPQRRRPCLFRVNIVVSVGSCSRG